LVAKRAIRPPFRPEMLVQSLEDNERSQKEYNQIRAWIVRRAQEERAWTDELEIELGCRGQVTFAAKLRSTLAT
jgi:hypothetical protein